MSQVFGGDSVNGAGNTTVVTTAETNGALGNFLSPPFGNGKAIVMGCLTLTVGTGTVSVAVRLRRNPNTENVIVASTGQVTVTAGNVVELTIVGADAIPDGRPVQYSITVAQTGATGNGTINQANITALLISG